MLEARPCGAPVVLELTCHGAREDATLQHATTLQAATRLTYGARPGTWRGPVGGGKPLDNQAVPTNQHAQNNS